MPVRPPVFRPNGYVPYEGDRLSERDRGYTKAWAKASALFKQEHPLCVGCEAVGKVVVTEVTDHVIPHKGNKVLFWDQANWQPACRPHHDVVKQRLEKLYAQGKVKASDLRLDSPKAIELTKDMLGVGGI